MALLMLLYNVEYIEYINKKLVKNLASSYYSYSWSSCSWSLSNLIRTKLSGKGQPSS